MFEPI